MKKNIFVDDIEPEDIVSVQITKEPDTGWYIGRVGEKFDCVLDYEGNYTPVEDIKAVKNFASLCTRFICPADCIVLP